MQTILPEALSGRFFGADAAFMLCVGYAIGWHPRQARTEEYTEWSTWDSQVPGATINREKARKKITADFMIHHSLLSYLLARKLALVNGPLLFLHLSHEIAHAPTAPSDSRILPSSLTTVRACAKI